MWITSDIRPTDNLLFIPHDRLRMIATDNRGYLFGSREMRSRKRKARKVPTRLENPKTSSDFDLTFPATDRLVGYLRDLGVRFDVSKKYQTKTEEWTMTDECSAFGTLSAGGVDYDILIRHPDKFDVFTFVWDRIPYRVWETMLEKPTSLDQLVSIVSKEDSYKTAEMRTNFMNAMYELYLDNRLV